jgi:hypothetical protein
MNEGNDFLFSGEICGMDGEEKAWMVSQNKLFITDFYFGHTHNSCSM